MKNIVKIIVFLGLSTYCHAQKDATKVYKKRVLENIEVDFLASYYSQTGKNAAVTGGVGNEDLTDITPTIVVSIPLNADAILTLDVGISSYTSASSGNLNPFDLSAASTSGDDDDDRSSGGDPTKIIGSPWYASSGASNQDGLISVSGAYSHSSDDRNKTWGTSLSFSNEWDYSSLGFGANYNMLFNEKNTEIGFKVSMYLDNWNPQYPTELDSYIKAGNNNNSGFFSEVPIYNSNGVKTIKTSAQTWTPTTNFTLLDKTNRNTYSVSFSFSQIVSKNAQFSVFFDIVKQNGWLSNPMQRVYFGDKEDYFIGNPESIPVYESTKNTNVFMLADDFERLPSNRFKLPIGARYHHFINEFISLRTYYRFYYDDWGVQAHTTEIELPIKVGNFTIYPSYRYYIQTAADYFSKFNSHKSTSTYYTSDYDLSEFDANQYGVGVSYTDIFTRASVWKLGVKAIDLSYNNYTRSNGLKANYFGLGIKMIIE